MINIAILAVENSMKSSIIGPLDVLTIASREWSRSVDNTQSDLFRLKVITDDGSPTTCFLGTKIYPHHGKDNCKDLDVIFIPVIHGDLNQVLSNMELTDWLYRQNKKGVIICAVCAGVFLAAETGLLNNREATTHWNLAEDFQKRYPDVLLKEEKMIIDEGDFITAAGATAYLDLSIYLAGRFGSSELVSTLSKLLLIDPSRRLQTPYKGLNFNIRHNDKEVLKVQQWIEENITNTISLSILAEIAGLGSRTFMRRFKKATGNTPLEYIQHLRIGKARTLLERTGQPFDSITYEVGYEDTSSFRRLFRKNTGLSPSDYRKRFSLF
ncbi:helix-turn-helix domain-containing protein [Desulfogranum marinum]|uniref:GlxA family transcriptional regulator n=1 Tax=Desulfogranum marinum TaxID=453220 RepID=UPI0029C8E859|nr:helix-turn-helix domain-containing protein [Desulfogranum marinum]